MSWNCSIEFSTMASKLWAGSQFSLHRPINIYVFLTSLKLPQAPNTLCKQSITSPTIPTGCCE